ncbi:MAG TPA: hypothetical protein VF611_04585 [Pyrinomonadaceae bacterium]|jgi:hypothetical protein
MNDAPRRTLRGLIDRHGPGLCSDARRCEGLLRDLCGEHRREINILVGALRERVPLDLLAARNSVPHELLLTRLARRLEEHLALTEEAARWAVGSWALALGVVSDEELKEGERRRAADAAPRVEAEPRTPAEPPRTQQSPPPTPAQRSRTPPPLPPPTTQPPQPTRTPPAVRPTGARPSPPAAPRPGAQGGPTVAARQTPPPQSSLAPSPHAPVSPWAANAGRLQTPSADPRPGRGRWRGCLVGCLVLILLSALLFAGGPLVLNLLREEQRNLEPPPVQTR